jgi:hypothetical protein
VSFLPCVVYAVCHKLALYDAKCLYAEVPFLPCVVYAECRHAECHCANCHCVKCHCAECRYAEFRGAYKTDRIAMDKLLNGTWAEFLIVDMNILVYATLITKEPTLKLKTWPSQHLGSLRFAFTLPQIANLMVGLPQFKT